MDGQRVRHLRATSIVAMALVAGIAACGGDAEPLPLAPALPPPPRGAPVIVDRIPDQSMITGQTVTVPLSFHFADPEGDALTYAATWPASGVVPISATLSGSTLTIVGLAGGTTTVAVTASDPGGLTATESFSVVVTWANRAPAPLLGSLSLGLPVGGAIQENLAGLFHDYDGDTLTYTAESSAPDIAAVSVSDSILTIRGLAAGVAFVTVTATDPDGLSAMTVIRALIQGVEPGGFRDDFTSSASLSDWEATDAEATVADDLLRITNTEAGAGVVVHEFGRVLGSWTLRVSMGRAQADGAASVWWATGDERYSWWRFDIGADSADGERNYQLYLADEEEGAWLRLTDVSGNSEAIEDGPNELTEITIEIEDGVFYGLAGDDELFRVQPSESLAFLLSRTTGVALGSVGDAGGTALFDWVEMTGILGGAAAGTSPDLSGDIRSLRLPGSVSMTGEGVTPGRK